MRRVAGVAAWEGEFFPRRHGTCPREQTMQGRPRPGSGLATMPVAQLVRALWVGTGQKVPLVVGVVLNHLQRKANRFIAIARALQQQLVAAVALGAPLRCGR